MKLSDGIAAGILLANNADEAAQTKQNLILSLRIYKLPVLEVFAKRRCPFNIIALLLMVPQPIFGIDYLKGQLESWKDVVLNKCYARKKQYHVRTGRQSAEPKKPTS